MTYTDAHLLALHRDGQTYAEIAAALNLSKSGVRGRISRQRRKASQTAPVATFTLPAILSGRSAPALTDLTHIDPQTDQGVFLERLHAARADGGYCTVTHLSDIHAPYQHAPALDVTYQLLAHVQPDFIVVGSDFWDFGALSKFEQDADEADNDDVLDALESDWNAHIHAVKKAAPNATRVFILGNHEKRLWDGMLRLAPQVRKTVWRRFVEIVRCGGSVLWLGEVDAVRFGPLKVMHGNRVTLNAARAMLMDTGGQLNIMAGHVHRLTTWTQRGEDFPVQAITGGCLCRYPSPYQKRKTPTSRWHLGTAFAEVNLRGRDVHVDNLEFQVDAGHVWARFERRTFAAAIPAPTGLISFEDWLAKQKREAA